MSAAALALLLLLADCAGTGCLCHETASVKRSKPTSQTIVAPQQSGPPASVTITVPPQMNATVCLC